MRIPSRSRRRQLISLTALIDVVFILLLFFMLASSFLDWRSIRLHAPAHAAGGAAAEGAMLLRIGADGGLDLNGVALSREEVEARIKSRLAQRPDQRILVQPEEGVSLQQAVETLDFLARIGGGNASLMRDGRGAR